MYLNIRDGVNIMKNALNYFYNIINCDIHQNKKMFYFDYENYRYALVPYKGDVTVLQSIYDLHVQALRHGIYVHQIILNRDKQIATLINGVPYILMRVFYDEGEITLEKIYSFVNMRFSGNNSIERTNWGILWADKIDYLEYEIGQLGQKHPEIRDTFSYFVGMGETAIQLVNMVLGDEKKNLMVLKTISHDRIRAEDTLFDLYNPLNLVVDYRIRDMAEYFKHCFFAGHNIEGEIMEFMQYGNLSSEECLLFLARMLYPTYYFDLYEDIISGVDRKTELKKVISKVDDYQYIIKNIYRYYRNYLSITPIEWLE